MIVHIKNLCLFWRARSQVVGKCQSRECQFHQPESSKQPPLQNYSDPLPPKICMSMMSQSGMCASIGMITIVHGVKSFLSWMSWYCGNFESVRILYSYHLIIIAIILDDAFCENIKRATHKNIICWGPDYVNLHIKRQITNHEGNILS